MAPKNYAPQPRHKCPRCGSPRPERHPAVQIEGEINICPDEFHLIPTNMNRPEYIALVSEKRHARGLPGQPA